MEKYSRSSDGQIDGLHVNHKQNTKDWGFDSNHTMDHNQLSTASK